MYKKFIILLVMISALCPGAEFKFAVLGDSQFHNPETFEAIVREVVLLEPDFVIQIGDMIHGYTYEPEHIRGEWERFKRQIAPITVPFYPVPGNHDVGTKPMEDIYKEVWGQDKLFYSFDHKGCHFVILDTDYYPDYGKITPNQIEWLSKDLEANKDAGHIFVFFHQPVWRSRNSGWDGVAALLKKYGNARTVFAGHTHEYCLEDVGGIQCYILNSSGHMDYHAPAVGYFHQFLYVSVKEESVRVAIIPYGSVKPGDYVSRKERDRVAPYFVPVGGGQIPDAKDAPLDFVYSFPLRNRTKEMNVYKARWVLPNPAFSVEPLEQAILLGPNRTEDVYVRITAPQGDYAYYSLPYALLETYYNTLRSESVALSSRHDLCIPRQSVARYASRRPHLDGLLDDTAWQSAEIIEDFQVDKAGNPADVQTWVRALYDRENLYVGAHCEEPNPEDLVALAKGPIPFTWGDDDIEIFLDVNHDKATYARAFVNCAGTTFSSLPGKGLCDAFFDQAVHIGKDYWAAELRIPFKNLGVEDTPSSMTLWGFNVRRHRQKPFRVQSDWVKMQNVPYEPWRFGILRFAPEGTKPTAPSSGNDK
ncbi:metallophosphoesterase [Candidatus Sumerlaeota bacterium]|nr:metallophosphoesterase [Candidatus Sumerlaeota bacterium]